MSESSSSVVDLDVTSDGIAVIRVTNPPVNALSKAVRVGVLNAMEESKKDSNVKAIVITSQIPLFSGGADISEFDSKDMSPFLPEVLDVIERSPKPVVAAVNGAAFGGGLEVALACHYRVSFSKNKVGLPEVHLGILPGAGGTQRLPRLSGVLASLDLIVTGKPKGAAKMPGLFDKLVEQPQDVADAAIEFAKEVVAKEMGPRPTRELSVDTSELPEDIFEQYLAGVKKTARGFYAPAKCVEAVKNAVELDFDEGLKQEQALFMECLATEQSAAQRHVFFSERKAGAIEGIPEGMVPRKIASVAVIGAGTMGGGIAMNFLNAGIPVKIMDMNQDGLDKGLAIIRKNYEATAAKGKLSGEQVEQRMSLLQGTTQYEDLSDVDLVIEAVFEKMSVKKDVFSKLDEVCKPGAILASNTSTLDIDEIATATKRPTDVIGMHFFSPANVMKLLEVVKTKDSAPDVILTVMKLSKKINKVAVLVGVCFGFVGNRMIETYARESNRLLLEGATPEQIDRVLLEFGMPMGPFTMGDMAGLDIGYFVRESRRSYIEHDPSYCVVADKLVEQGRVGLKVGKGAYLYEKGSRKPIPDPEVLKIAKQEAERLGIKQREISDQEILERCIYPLINEGADILKEGIASKPSDIDIIYVYGYGFPVYRGGPMHFGDVIGPQKLVQAIEKYRDQLGQYGQDWFQPSTFLVELAERNGKFSDLN